MTNSLKKKLNAFTLACLLSLPSFAMAQDEKPEPKDVPETPKVSIEEDKGPTWRQRLAQRKKEKRDYRLHFTRGVLAQENGEYKKAINHYDDAIHYNPQSANVYAFRGYCEMKLADTDDAIASLRKALILNPELKEAYLFLGQTYLLRYRMEDAKEQVKKLQVLDPAMAAELEKAINEKAKIFEPAEKK